MQMSLISSKNIAVDVLSRLNMVYINNAVKPNILYYHKQNIFL